MLAFQGDLQVWSNTDCINTSHRIPPVFCFLIAALPLFLCFRVLLQTALPRLNETQPAVRLLGMNYSLSPGPSFMLLSQCLWTWGLWCWTGLTVSFHLLYLVIDFMKGDVSTHSSVLPACLPFHPSVLTHFVMTFHGELIFFRRFKVTWVQN